MNEPSQNWKNRLVQISDLLTLSYFIDILHEIIVNALVTARGKVHSDVDYYLCA